jgi:hypothetical protein
MPVHVDYSFPEVVRFSFLLSDFVVAANLGSPLSTGIPESIGALTLRYTASIIILFIAAAMDCNARVNQYFAGHLLDRPP